MNPFSFDVGTADFQEKVIDASHRAPVLVDFWAEWCAPCRALKPVLEKLAAEYGGRFVLAKLNSDRNPEIAARCGVRGIPDVKAFVAGKLVAGLAAGSSGKWVVGWGMVPRGEVGLIFAMVGKNLGVMNEAMFSVIVLMVILTTLITPPVLTWLLRRQ